MKNALALLVAIVLCAGGAVAQERYPQKPLRIVVPFAPGGSTDIIARLIGERLSGALGQPVVIENRAGAAGNIGAEIVAKSAPDGYTLLMATTGVMSINNALYQNMSFDSSTNFDYVVFVASITNVLIVAADSPLHNVAELIADSPAVLFLPKVSLSGTAIRSILAGPDGQGP
jgi:tripartite-type tricarboxylate transporter receptor subunit TctC